MLYQNYIGVTLIRNMSSYNLCRGSNSKVKLMVIECYVRMQVRFPPLFLFILLRLYVLKQKFFLVLQSLSEAKDAYNYIILAHKALAWSSVPEGLAKLITPKTSIVLLQNGVGTEEPYRQAFPATSIMTTAVSNLLNTVCYAVIPHSC